VQRTDSAGFFFFFFFLKKEDSIIDDSLVYGLWGIYVHADRIEEKLVSMYSNNNSSQIKKFQPATADVPAQHGILHNGEMVNFDYQGRQRSFKDPSCQSHR
jgi:hypothetical protein